MAEAEEPKMNEFVEKCFEFLADEGYRPKIDSNYSNERNYRKIEFKKEGVFYAIDYFNAPFTLFAIRTLMHYEQAAFDRLDVLELVNESNLHPIDVKVAVMSDLAVLFKSECYYLDLFDIVFEEKMSAIQLSVAMFDEKMLELKSRGT